MKITELLESTTVKAEKPRNFVAKNAKMGGAGKMKDKSKTLPRQEKHKKPAMAEANIQPTSAGSRSHISNLSHPTTNSVTHPSSGKEIGLITKQPDGKYYAHPSSVKLSHNQGGTFDTKEQAHQYIRNAHARAIKTGTLSDKWMKKQPLPQFAKGQGVVEGDVAEDSIRPNLAAALKQLGFNGPFKLEQLPKWMAELQDGRFDKNTSIMIGGDDPQHDPWVAKGYDYGYAYGMESGYQTGLSAQEVVKQVRADTQNTDGMAEGVAGPKSCWPGHRKVGTQPGTGKNAGKPVNKCKKIGEQRVVEGSVKELKLDLRVLSDEQFQKENGMTKAAARAGLRGKSDVTETADAASTSAGHVSVGVVYKNKPPKMQKPGTNALDQDDLLTGGSLIKRR